MTPPRPNPVARLLPSLADVAFLMPMVFLFLRMEGASQMLEGDTGWHIRAGEWILANGRVPDRDLFSFTRPGEPWFAWEWLWDVLFARLHQWWGLPAVVVTSLLLLSVTFTLLYRLAVNKGGNVLVAIALTLLAMAASAMHWLARPHLVTLLFTVLAVSVLDKAQTGQTRRLWLLPLLTVPWTNLHGGFLVGIMLAVCYAAGHLGEALVAAQPEVRRAALYRSRAYGLTAAGCLVASLLNPYGYRLHLHILKYVSDPQSPFFRWVSEWQSMSFHHAGARYFEALMMLAVAAGAWHLHRRRFGYALAMMLWMHLALVSARHVPIFAILAAPLVAQAFGEILERVRQAEIAGWLRRALETFQTTAAEAGAIDRIPRWRLASLAGAVLVITLCSAPQAAGKFRADYDRKAYPTQALDRLPASGLWSGVFAPDEWGDYLIYRLYPDVKVFIDGRFDFYGSRFTEKYLDVMNVKYDWEDNLKRYGIQTVLLPVDAALAGALKQSARWRPVYDDGVAIAFRAAGPAAVVDNLARDRAITTADNRDRGITLLP